MGVTMGTELIDLTTTKITDEGWSKTDIIILLTTGGVGYLAKEAYKYFFPAAPSLAEQTDALERLIKAASNSNAKKLTVRISAAANAAFHAPEVVKGAKVVAKRNNLVDLELTFA